MEKNETPNSSKFFHLTDLNDWISPFSFSLMVPCCLFCYATLFQPSLRQFGVFLAVDFISIGIFKQFEFKVFVKIFPKMTPFAPTFENEKLNDLSLNEKISTIRAMMEFPLKRAWHVFYTSTIKSIPPALIVVFIWNLHGRSHLEQLFLLIAMMCLVFSFFFASTFIESHLYLSKKLKELSSQNNEWKEAFFKVEVAKNHKSFSNTYKYSMLCLAALGLWLTNTVVALIDYSSPAELTMHLSSVALIIFTLCGRVAILYQQFFELATQDIFGKIDQIEQNRDIFIPLHTVGFFARFEKEFNLMAKRLMKKEAETNVMVEELADKTRFQGIGELSGLLSDELDTPTQEILKHLQVLKNNRDEFSSQNIESMGKSVERLDDLIATLRLKLKNSTQTPKTCSLSLAIDIVKKLHLTQYKNLDFNEDYFRIHSNVDGINVLSSRILLTSLFENLFKHSLQCLTENIAKKPLISIELLSPLDLYNPYFTLLYKDSESNFSAEKFDAATSYATTISQNYFGLKLARKIAELIGGRLDFDMSSESSTTYKLLLPRQLSALSTT